MRFTMQRAPLNPTAEPEPAMGEHEEVIHRPPIEAGRVVVSKPEDPDHPVELVEGAGIIHENAVPDHGVCLEERSFSWRITALVPQSISGVRVLVLTRLGTLHWWRRRVVSNLNLATEAPQ